MHLHKPLLASALAMVSVAKADWTLSSYTAIASDSSQTNSIYGIQAFSNPASSATIAVPGGYLSLIAPKIASEPSTTPSGDGNTANVGLLHPLTSDWAEYDLTGLTGITFEYRNATKITDVLPVTLGSASYSAENLKSGMVYTADLSGATTLAAGPYWKKATIAPADFAPPIWSTIPANYLSIDSVLKRVKYLQFAVTPLYTDSGMWNGKPCKKCTNPTMTSQTLDIRNIVLQGVKVPADGFVPLVGCTEGTKAVAFDAFQAGSSKNAANGYWFAFSDYDTLKSSYDLDLGRSVASTNLVAGGTRTNSYLQLNAKLDKRDGSIFHSNAGWADLATNLPSGSQAFTKGLTGIGFTLQSQGINSARVPALLFKVKMEGVSDATSHFVSLPTSTLNAVGSAGKRACIRLSDLHQPSYAFDSMALDPIKISQLAWEVRIPSNNISFDTATANFRLSDVVFYSKDTSTTGLGFSTKNSENFVRYFDGTLNLSGFAGALNFEVTSLDGRLVASFAPASRVALALPRGTYFVRARGTGVSTKFTVLGR